MWCWNLQLKGMWTGGSKLRASLVNMLLERFAVEEENGANNLVVLWLDLANAFGLTEML